METPAGATLQMLQQGGESPHRGCRVGMWGWGLRPQMGDNVLPPFPCAVRLHGSTPHNPDPTRCCPTFCSPRSLQDLQSSRRHLPEHPKKWAPQNIWALKSGVRHPRGPGLGTQTRSMGLRGEAKPPPHPVPGGFPVYFLPY